LGQCRTLLTLIAGLAASLALALQLRPAPEAIKWRFEVAGQYILQPPAVATARAWRWPPRAAAVLADGGRGAQVVRCPGRRRRWAEYRPRTERSMSKRRAHHRGCAPTERSGGRRRADERTGCDRRADGRAGRNIYVVSDFGGIGAYALSPRATLLWSNPGDPTFNEYGQLGAVASSARGRLFASVRRVQASDQSATMYGLTLGGTQDWAVPVPTRNDIFMQRQAQPARRPWRKPVSDRLEQPVRWSLVTARPRDGAAVWSYTQ
jgi:hypothetical protein